MNFPGTKLDISFEKMETAVKNPRMALSFTYNDIFAEYFYRLPSAYLSTVSTVGTNVLSKDWDVLILLDTARIDALKVLSEEYEFINNVNDIKSTGGATSEWVAATFTEDHPL
jgi:hypothetical protein